MAVTITRAGKPIPKPTKHGKVSIEKFTPPPGRVKLAKAIQEPFQFSVKVTAEQKAEWKLMAAKRRMTLLTMFAEALADFIASPPSNVTPEITPDNWTKFSVKVDQELREQVERLARTLNVSHQGLIAFALNAYLTKFLTSGETKAPLQKT